MDVWQGVMISGGWIFDNFQSHANYRYLFSETASDGNARRLLDSSLDNSWIYLIYIKNKQLLRSEPFWSIKEIILIVCYHTLTSFVPFLMFQQNVVNDVRSGFTCSCFFFCQNSHRLCTITFFLMTLNAYHIFDRTRVLAENKNSFWGVLSNYSNAVEKFYALKIPVQHIL